METFYFFGVTFFRLFGDFLETFCDFLGLFWDFFGSSGDLLGLFFNFFWTFSLFWKLFSKLSNFFLTFSWNIINARIVDQFSYASSQMSWIHRVSGVNSEF